jgi:hypothetical protein
MCGKRDASGQGEINTLAGNRNSIRTREALMTNSKAFGDAPLEVPQKLPVKRFEESSAASDFPFFIFFPLLSDEVLYPTLGLRP